MILVLSAAMTFILSVAFCQSWVIVPVDHEMPYKNQWKKTYYYVAKNYGVEVFSENDGYIWSGRKQISSTKWYELEILFSETRETIEFRYIKITQDPKKGLTYSSNNSTVNTIRMDLMGLLGRVIR